MAEVQIQEGKWFEITELSGSKLKHTREGEPSNEKIVYKRYK